MITTIVGILTMLYSESEQVIKEALDKAGEGHTRIVKAHCLPTVYNGQWLIVLPNASETATAC